MNEVVSYFVSVIAVVLLSGIVASVLKDGMQKQIILCISGVLLLLVLLRPLGRVKGDALERLFSDVVSDLSAEEYEELFMDAFREQITKTSEEYIRNKAEELGASVVVRIELTEETYPVPHKVTVYGSLSVQQMEELKEFITHSMDISPENQFWRTYDEITNRYAGGDFLPKEI